MSTDLLKLLLALCELPAQAAATLPLIAALTLIGGRRGDAALCIMGGRKLVALGLILAAFGPIRLILAYLLQVLPYHAGLARMFAPFFQPAGLPWSASLIVWLAGWLALFLAAAKIPQNSVSGRHNPGAAPLFLCLLATFFYFLTFLLAIWPFAGLPEGLPWDRALMAIWRHATSAWFMTLSPAAGFALAAWPLWRKSVSTHQTATATRWLSFWACAGLLPSLLVNWGRCLGALGNAQRAGALAQGLQIQLLSLAILTGALSCWALLLWKPRLLPIIALPAPGLLLLKILLPLILNHV